MAAEFNPAKFFVLGQQSRMMEEKMKADKAEQARQAMLPQARREYFSGYGQQLQQAAPGEWSQLETQRVTREKTAEQMRVESAKRAREMLLMQSKGMFASLTEASRDPSKWGRVVDRMESLGFAKPGQMPREAPPIDQLMGMVDEQGSIITSLQEDPNVTPLMANVMAQFGYGPGQEGGALRDERVQQVLADEMSASRSSKTSESFAKNPANLLRKEFHGLDTTKKAYLAELMVGKIRAASPNAAGDIGLVFSFMKMLDPGSVVREGEQALARNAAGVPERVRTTYNRALKGESLSEDQRIKFKQEAEKLLKVYRGRFDAVAQEYKRLAQKNGVDPRDVVLNPGRTAKSLMDELSGAVAGELDGDAKQSNTPQGQVITNGQQSGFLPQGTPMPEGWSVQ